MRLFHILVLFTLPSAAIAEATKIFGSRTFGTVVAIPVEGMREVHASLIIGVGAADDNGLEGLAHYAEHRAFVGARNETGYRGTINAYTTLKTTEFTSISPAHDLEYSLKFFGAVLRSIDIAADEFAYERRRISREIEVASQRPIDRGSLCAARAAIFALAPWQNCVIGEQPVIDTLTAEQVSLFQENFYQAENSVLVIMGGFDLDEIEEDLGKLTTPNWRFEQLPNARIDFNAPTSPSGLDDRLLVGYRAIELPEALPSLDEHGLLTLIAFLVLEDLENALRQALAGNRHAQAVARRAEASPTWGEDLKNCMRTGDTRLVSDTPATDTFIGCVAKTKISRW